MTATTSIPYDWLRKIPHSLLEKDEIPILSSPGPFPIDRFSALLAKTFQLDRLDIQLSPWENRSSEHLLKGLGEPLKIVNIELSPLSGTLTWAMSEKDINLLMAIVLTKEARASDLIDKSYLDGFFDFLTMEALLAFNRTEYDKGLVPHIIDSAAAPDEGNLSLDVLFNCNGTSFNGRLILSEEFRHSWKERNAQRKMTIDMSPELAEKIQVIVHLEAGNTCLKRSEWASVHPGDYIPLDDYSYEPGTDKSRVMITLHGQPLFRAKIKQGNIKILEFPLYHEVETPMKDDDDDFDFEDDDDDDSFHDDDDEDYEDDEGDDDDDFDIGDDDPSIADVKTPPPIKKAEPPAVQPSTETKVKPAQTSMASADTIDMTIVVEVGRLQMSVQKLLELQPGNLLELDVHPENGVDLVVQGRCIARGELLRIGDTLGVRILDKG